MHLYRISRLQTFPQITHTSILQNLIVSSDNLILSTHLLIQSNLIQKKKYEVF